MAFLKVEETVLAKSVVYWAEETPVLVLMAGNDELNEAKLMAAVGAQVRPVEGERLRELIGADGGSIGPVGLKAHAGGKFKIMADKRLEGANNLVSGANRNDLPPQEHRPAARLRDRRVSRPPDHQAGRAASGRKIEAARS